MDIGSDEQQLALAQTIARAMEKAHAEGKGTEFEAELKQRISQAAQDAYAQGVEMLVAALQRAAPKMLAEHREYRAGFEARLRERWGTALDLYETILVIAQEAGETFRDKHAARAEKDNDLVFWVLVRLHARACQTASEVMALLCGGYATAAMTRWRTIHEISVTMTLIREHGNEIAQRYLHHEIIEAAAGAREYQTYHARLGYEPFDTVTFNQLIARRAAVLKQHGSDFGSSYGWAEQALGKNKPTFARLEKAAKLDHMRPFYRMASHGVHSNPKGILFHLDSIGPARMLAAGASNAGLADPGHATLISLGQCTTTFLLTAPDDFTIVTTQAMFRLIDEAGQQFLAAHQALVQDEERLRGCDGPQSGRSDGGTKPS